MSSEDFIQAQRALELEWVERKAEHFYLAQIALEVCRGRMKNPSSAKLEHFLLDFKLGDESKSRSLEQSEEEMEKNLQACLGIVGED